jgi:sugar phosphate isomerase/epimerase
MKLSIVVSTQPASFSALAYQGQLEENILRIKQLGYDGVELAVRDPKLLSLERLDHCLRKNNLLVPAVGTGQAFGEEGLSFIHPDEKVRRQAIDRIISQMDLAGHLRAVVIIGLIRGKSSSEIGLDHAEDWLFHALKECEKADTDVKLAIEPINRYETDLINTVESGLRFLDRLRLDNVGLLLDTFHMNIEESSILDSISLAKDRLFHVHVADSNRWYPGAGHIDFEGVVDRLNKIGYQGFLSAEILPEPDPDMASFNTIQFLRRLLPE